MSLEQRLCWVPIYQLHQRHTAECVHGRAQCELLQIVSDKQTSAGICRVLGPSLHLHAKRLAQERRLHALPLNAERREAAERVVLLVISDEVLRMCTDPDSAANCQRPHDVFFFTQRVSEREMLHAAISLHVGKA